MHNEKVDIADYTMWKRCPVERRKVNCMPKAAGLSGLNIAVHPWSYKKILHTSDYDVLETPMSEHSRGAFFCLLSPLPSLKLAIATYSSDTNMLTS